MISIIIPLYNKADNIAKTLESVFAQTYQDFEIVIVDDGSTDESLTVVQALNDPRIRIITQENSGVSAARNRGIAEAKYDLIAFLDADDNWLPEYLNTIFLLTLKYQKCDIFATQYTINTTNTNIKGLQFNQDGILEDYFTIASNNQPPLWTSAITVTKKAIESIGGFPIGIKSGEDLLTWARLAAKFQIAYSNTHLSIYNNDVQNWEPGRPTDTQDTVGIELKKLLEEKNLYSKISLKHYIGLWYKMRASTFIRHQKRFLALKQIALSLFYNPWNVKTYLYIPITFLPIQLFKKIFGK